MSLSYFEITVPVFRQGLTGLSWVMAKADSHFTAEGRDTAELMNDRIAPDMLPFGFQVAQVVSHSQGALERMTGRGNLIAKPAQTLAEARQLVASALEAVNALTPAELEGCETRRITWQPVPNVTMEFDGAQPYLVSFATPNFYFHAATAYAIARKNGVTVGKRDFMARGDAPPGV
jgi:uncharacterized protein